MDLNALNRLWEQRVKRIAALVETVPGVTTDIQVPRTARSGFRGSPRACGTRSRGWRRTGSTATG